MSEELTTTDPALNQVSTFLRTLDPLAVWYTPLSAPVLSSIVSKIEGMRITTRTVYATIPNETRGDKAIRLTQVTVLTSAVRRGRFQLDRKHANLNINP
jgi:hypothetical protein